MQTTRGAPLGVATGRRPARGRGGWVVGTAVVVVLADLVSKLLVVARLSDRPPVTVIPGVLHLTIYRNPGAAFGLGSGATVVFSVVAVIVVVVIARTVRRLRSRGWGVTLGLLLGGAVGNLGDRVFRSPGVFRGHVVDWIALPHWPVFNLADSSIVVGGVLAVLLSLLGVSIDAPRSEPAGPESVAPPSVTS